MSSRPTIKLKPTAAKRNPQRLRVRATTAPRNAAKSPAADPAEAPAKAAPRKKPPRAAPQRPRPPQDGSPQDRPPQARPPRPPRPQQPSPSRSPEAPAPFKPRPQAKPFAAPAQDAAPSRAPRVARAPLEPARPVRAAQPARPAAAVAAKPAHAQGIRLSKHLTDQGIASRREADDWIAAGWVRVDGQMAVLGQRVLPHQRIDIDPAARQEQARSVTVLLNKPVGYVSGQAEDGYEPASVLVTPDNHWPEDPSRRPFHPGHARNLAPAGRLDIDSTGLLVLTQDGRVAKLLIGEHSLVEKEYLVRVAHAFGEAGVPASAMALLRHGLELDGQPLKPAKVSWANEDQLRVVLNEGKKRQIRRMCEAVGLQVLGLKRVRIGSVVLGKLPPGQWRYLRDDERF